MTRQVRYRRRAILVATMIAVSPSMADEPAETSARMMPPLPLNSTESIETVKANPFCDTEKIETGGPSVQLASSNKKPPAVRLKPIGLAIGLHPIGVLAPGTQELGSILIETPQPARVQTNNLVNSRHNENDELVDTQVDSVVQMQALGSVDADLPAVVVSRQPVHSSILLIPPKPAKQSSQQVVIAPPITPAADSDQPPTPPAAVPSSTDTAQQDPQDQDPTQQDLQQQDSVITQQAPQTPVAVVAAVPPVLDSSSVLDPSSVPQEVDEATLGEDDSEPIFFSMSDESETSPSSEPHDGDLITSEEPELAELNATKAQNKVLLVEPVVIEDNLPESLREPELATTQSELTPLPMITSEDEAEVPTLIYRDEPVVHAPVTPKEETPPSKRYRPPVAVTQLPLAFERPATDPTASIVRPAVKPVEAPQLDELPPIADGQPKPTRLYLSRTQVRSLTVGGELRRVKIGDKNVCQAFAAGPNSLKLIGTGNGVTQLVVWADTASDTPTRVRTFEIHVADAVETTGEAVVDRVDMLNRSVRKLFPESRVSIRLASDQLIVSGRCDSEETATKIIRMIRKTCSIAVRDELQVR